MNIDKNISTNFLKNGYVIVDIDDLKSLDKIMKLITAKIRKIIKIPKNIDDFSLLNNFHKYMNVSNLNNFRVKIIQSINTTNNFKELYYNLVKNYLDEIVGNEIAIQNRVNMSIQLPKDDSSLLPVHADTWAGDSPFEVVVWLPLVDCYKTKSMFILKASKYDRFIKDFKKNRNKSSEYIFNKIKKDVTFLNIKYGQVLIFNQALPHGNRINKEVDTRWSFNCRFKGLFTPYGDKKLGEFFQPLKIKPATRIGMKYKLPKI